VKKLNIIEMGMGAYEELENLEDYFIYHAVPMS
jgi:hypothetical protein